MGHFEKDADSLERVLGRAAKIIGGLGNVTGEERLKTPGLLSLEKRRLGPVFDNHKSDDRGDGDEVFSVAAGERTRSNGFKVQMGKAGVGDEEALSGQAWEQGSCLGKSGNFHPWKLSSSGWTDAGPVEQEAG